HCISNSILHLKAAYSFDQNRIAKSLWKKLLPFQREGIEQVLLLVLVGKVSESVAAQIVMKFNGRCIVADEMGLGKTVQAIGLISYYHDDLPVLIVVPSSLRFHWKDTLLNWLPEIDENRIHVISSGSCHVTNTRFGSNLVAGSDWPRNENSVDFMIISYALLSKFQSDILQWNPRFTILDESHFIKTLTTQRSRAAAPIIKGFKPFRFSFHVVNAMIR
ncbi:hypothetical protein BVRB_033600, partial [Beta vulgaris subsp. vulgaris]